MIKDERISQIQCVIDYHKKLHKTIVMYALLDDLERKMVLYCMTRTQIEDIVNKLLKADNDR